MRHPRVMMGTIFVALLATLASPPTPAGGQQADMILRAELQGFQEIPTLSTPGTGKFRARVTPGGDQVEYNLDYSNLEGEVTQAHIHLGAPAFNGGIMVFLCSNLPAPPPGTPACPVPDGSVHRTFSRLDVIGPEGQGISPGEFEEVIRAMRSGATYANVHTTLRPGGEIRGQILNDN